MNQLVQQGIGYVTLTHLKFRGGDVDLGMVTMFCAGNLKMDKIFQEMLVE